MQQETTPSTLFEILRSFTTLASTLNLSETVQRLGVTRQTVRRHINTLEELKGAKLFELRNRSYFLTDAGMQCRLEAQAILDQTEDWLRNKSVRARSRGALERVSYKDEKGYSFHAQQHHLGRLWVDAPPLLRRAFEAWSQAELQLEHPAMTSIKAYRLVYRRLQDSWLCVEVGESSSYATWLGWEWAKSAVGRFSQDDPVGTDFDNFMSQAYHGVFVAGGARLDHIAGLIPRARNAEAIPARFQRLLLGCVFPDGEPALALFVARTNRVEIAGLGPNEIPEMPAELLMEDDV
ncbi:LysR family transcriptional regulator [Pelagibius marinus]|uniref:LysR family transcriptional regulator n=1 Tax=Pelagibius marinus TaxID=2762760 RepID=UPI001872A56D|nr:LysR family transcriptional regulator [Pelagibius marinus]